MAFTSKNFLPVICAAALTCCLALCLAGCSNSSSSNSSGNASAYGNANASSNTNASGSANTANVKVVVGTMATEDLLPFWVAESEGMFAEAGLDVSIEVFQSATELIAAVTSGTVNFAMTDPMVTASIYSAGTDVQIKWITLGTTPEQGRFGIMTADKSIASINDLAGKSIGVGSNTILEYVMDKMLTKAGIADQVTKEELQKIPVRYQAMASGQVNAAMLPASLLALGEASGYTVVADDTTGENLSQSVMIMRSDFAKNDPDGSVLSALKSVWDQAATKINASPESYRALLVAKANLSDAVATSYPICTYPSCQLPEQAAIDDILSWMEAKGYLSTAISYNAADGTFSRK